MVDLVTIDGQRATPYMAYQLRRLKNDFRARFGLEIYAVSGIRLDWEQIQIFLARYVKAGEVNGRYVYDTRVWNGVRYYRISNAGTVAVPGTSNHEIQGDSAAWDFADSGSDAGVSRAGSARSNWLRDNAWRYDLEPEGFNFGEAWHYKAKKIFNAVPGSSSGNGGAPAPTPNPARPTRKKKKMDPWIAVLPNGRWVLIISQGNARPRAVTLQGNANAEARFGSPVFFDQQEIGYKSLQQAVDGV